MFALFTLIPMFKHVMLEKLISNLRIRYLFEEIFYVTNLYIYYLHKIVFLFTTIRLLCIETTLEHYFC